jgi:hypothetical protein
MSQTVSKVISYDRTRLILDDKWEISRGGYDCFRYDLEPVKGIVMENALLF